jgi:hypothetical protein
MKNRTRVLALAFVILLVFYFLRALPYEPRLIFTNDSGDDIAHLTVESGTSKANLGRVRNGESVTLPIKPRPGERCTILNVPVSIDELVRLREMVRRERRDVHVGVDFRDVSCWRARSSMR